MTTNANFCDADLTETYAWVDECLEMLYYQVPEEDREENMMLVDPEWLEDGYEDVDEDVDEDENEDVDEDLDYHNDLYSCAICNTAFLSNVHLKLHQSICFNIPMELDDDMTSRRLVRQTNRRWAGIPEDYEYGELIPDATANELIIVRATELEDEDEDDALYSRKRRAAQIYPECYVSSDTEDNEELVASMDISDDEFELEPRQLFPNDEEEEEDEFLQLHPPPLLVRQTTQWTLPDGRIMYNTNSNDDEDSVMPIT